MKVKDLIDKLNKCDLDKPIKLMSPSWDKEKLVGLSGSNSNVVVEIYDEVWLVDETSTEWLNEMNWQDSYK